MNNYERLREMYQRSADTLNIDIILYHLQMNSHIDITTDLFDCTPFDPDRPFYYCQTGMEKTLYAHRIGVTGQAYSRLFDHTISHALENVLAASNVTGSVYLIVDDSKEIGVVFQSHPGEVTDPLSVAERIDRTVQALYSEHLPHGTGSYCNTTALSYAVTGVEGIREGYLQTETLKAASFFRMTPGVMTAERLASLQNGATYRDVISLTRALCRAAAQGEDANTLALAEKLFLNLLKRSYDMELVRDALSYIKQFLTVRLSVHLPAETTDLAALCSPSAYITIEECCEAILPVLTRLCRAVQQTRAWSDTVAYAAYCLRSNLGQDVSLPEIAAFADATPAYLSSLFHWQTGMTIKQYQQRIRMEQACLLLETTGDRVTDIAARTGFTDRRYFTRTFKDVYGMTPQEYRLSKQKGGPCPLPGG